MEIFPFSKRILFSKKERNLIISQLRDNRTGKGVMQNFVDKRNIEMLRLITSVRRVAHSTMAVRLLTVRIQSERYGG